MVKGDENSSIPSVVGRCFCLVSVLSIHFDCVHKTVAPPKKNASVILLRYLPVCITTTSVQRPLSTVPKMAAVGRIDCKSIL